MTRAHGRLLLTGVGRDEARPNSVALPPVLEGIIPDCPTDRPKKRWRHKSPATLPCPAPAASRWGRLCCGRVGARGGGGGRRRGGGPPPGAGRPARGAQQGGAVRGGGCGGRPWRCSGRPGRQRPRRAARAAGRSVGRGGYPRKPGAGPALLRRGRRGRRTGPRGIGGGVGGGPGGGPGGGANGRASWLSMGCERVSVGGAFDVLGRGHPLGFTPGSRAGTAVVRRPPRRRHDRRIRFVLPAGPVPWAASSRVEQARLLFRDRRPASGEALVLACQESKAGPEAGQEVTPPPRADAASSITQATIFIVTIVVRSYLPRAQSSRGLLNEF
jgi:hypothetical protein